MMVAWRDRRKLEEVSTPSKEHAVKVLPFHRRIEDPAIKATRTMGCMENNNTLYPEGIFNAYMSG